MPAPNTLLIEGTFSELADELAAYLDGLRVDPAVSAAPGATTPPSVQAGITPALDRLRAAETREAESVAAAAEGADNKGGQAGQKAKAAVEEEEEEQKQVLATRDEVMKKIVTVAGALNEGPEKEIVAAYNLLLHLTRQTKDPSIFLPRIVGYLTSPIRSSPHHGAALALTVLSTVFNTLPRTDASRFHVFLGILAVIRQAGAGGAGAAAPAFDALKTQLRTQLPKWIVEWRLDEAEQQRLHLAISDAATDAGDAELSYAHLLAALGTVPAGSAAASPTAAALAERALLAALTLPFVFDFAPLTTSEAVQALRGTGGAQAALFDLLELFAADTLEAYDDFVAATPLASVHPTLAQASDALATKMRLLTLASAAAASPTRSLAYDEIATALRVPRPEVEKWVIDTIRAGLVEGKLSQARAEFLVQRATVRVFGERQWAEVQGRLAVWRRSLERVLAVVRSEKDRFGTALAGQVAQAQAAAAAVVAED